ncbi:uncharacterized protein LOC143069804 [Mytilus galloprovincialis]|uniref:uncharacterized protein LOC143069804 n=1 Tax=Mytilus galloprovincialis TaxID=29158 RepID=UPI003F7C0CEE
MDEESKRSDTDIRHIQALLFEQIVMDGESEDTVKLLDKHKDILDLEIFIETDQTCTCAKIYESFPYASLPDSTSQVEALLDVLLDDIRSGICHCHSSDESRLRDCKPSLSLIHIASGLGLQNIVRLLKQYGCNLNVRTSIYERTALHFAVKKHQIDVVDFLLSQNVDVNVQSNPDKVSPLALAMVSRFKDIVEKLLKVKNIDLDIRNSSNEGPVILAMHLVDEEMFGMLLDAGASPNVTDDRGNSALMLGTVRGACYVKKLISKGVNLNARNRRHESALFFATYVENEEIVQMLLQAGADPNLTSSDGTTALLTACYQGSTKIVQILVNHKSDINVSNPQRYSSIHIAAWNGYYQIVNILLKAGMHHDTPTRDGNTPIALAAHGGHQSVIDILLPLGCNVNNADKDKDTALHYAAYNNMVEGVRKLLECGADPNCQNSYKATPLWNAVYMKHKDIVKLLLTANVEMEVASVGINQHSQSDTAVQIYPKPCSPLYVAVDRGCFEIMLLLIAAGYNLHSEAWVFCDDMYPKENRDLNMQALLKKFASEPPRLIAVCRNFFRRSFGQQIHNKVQHLELPVTLKNYLILGDVLS